MAYAGRYRTLTCLSLILSALSGILALVPFVRLWRIIREVLEVQPGFSRFSFHRFKASIDDYQTTRLVVHDYQNPARRKNRQTG